jgi:hypothetical protein
MAARPHNFSGRLCGFVFCQRCGLVRLGNQASNRAARAPCPVQKESK